MNQSNNIDIFKSVGTQPAHQISAAWEHFLSTGTFSERQRPRELIVNSWKKSRDLGIDPKSQHADKVISAEEIEQSLRQTDLGIAGKNVIDKMAESMQGTRHVMVLADADGKIIYSVGHQSVQAGLEKINFRPGGGWSDELVGPNGIGTPIAVNRPEVIFGSEHYCEAWHPWVCYGAPIHDNNRNVIGCIDITGPAADVNIESLYLAVSLSSSIEQNIGHQYMYRREFLRESYTATARRYPDAAKILLDESCHVIDIDRCLIGLTQQASASEARYAELTLPHSLKEAATSVLETGEPAQYKQILPSGVLFESVLEPVNMGNKTLGVILLTEATTFGIFQEWQVCGFPDRHWNTLLPCSRCRNLLQKRHHLT